jgi:hypothetical protein
MAMTDIELNALATRVLNALLKRHPDWASHAEVIGSGDLELAVPAPPESRAGHLVVFTKQGTDIWIRFAPPHMCYAAETVEEMHSVITALLADDAFFVVVTRGDEWVETTLLRPGEEPVLLEAQVANVVSWSGECDRLVTFVARRTSESEGAS